jgi:hypothetical protein
MVKFFPIICLSAIAFSCSESEDPIISSLRSAESIHQFIEDLERKGLVNNLNRVDNEVPMNHFEINFDESKNLKFEMLINPDGYYIGNVREIHLKVPFSIFLRNQDTISLKQKFLAERYERLYGIPDTIVKTNFNRLIVKQVGDHSYRYIQANEPTPETNILEWEIDDYTINLALPEISATRNTVLSYRVKDFRKKTKIIQDSIENNYTVDDLIYPYNLSTGLSFNSKKDIEYSLSGYGLVRKNETDDRKITAIRFDAEIRDMFGEKLFSKEDITMDLPVPLTREEVGLEPVGNRFTLDANYSLRDKSYRKLVRVINYRKNQEVETVAVNLRVLLDDGSIITRRKGSK